MLNLFSWPSRIIGSILLRFPLYINFGRKNWSDFIPQQAPIAKLLRSQCFRNYDDNNDSAFNERTMIAGRRLIVFFDRHDSYIASNNINYNGWYTVDYYVITTLNIKPIEMTFQRSLRMQELFSICVAMRQYNFHLFCMWAVVHTDIPRQK